jgi:hypothetical protein
MKLNTAVNNMNCVPEVSHKNEHYLHPITPQVKWSVKSKQTLWVKSGEPASSTVPALHILLHFRQADERFPSLLLTQLGCSSYTRTTLSRWTPKATLHAEHAKPMQKHAAR